MTDAAAALGVATVRDFRGLLRREEAPAGRLAGDLGLVPVTVEGWGSPAWASPALLDAGTSGLRSRPTLVSPFDSLVWDRGRTERIFGFRHRLEAYTPRPKRVHGYFSMPLVVGDIARGTRGPRAGRHHVRRQGHAPRAEGDSRDRPWPRHCIARSGLLGRMRLHPGRLGDAGRRTRRGASCGRERLRLTLAPEHPPARLSARASG